MSKPDFKRKLPPPWSEQEAAKIETLVVAVHGIGSQYRYATIQSVAHRIASYLGGDVGVPLGSFHPPSAYIAEEREGKKEEPHALPFSGMPTLGLAEVFWAEIPQRAVKTEDTIEETKAWAKTMVQRVKAMDLKKYPRQGSPSFPKSVSAAGALAKSAAKGAREIVRIQKPGETGPVDYAKTSAVVGEMVETIATLENLVYLGNKAGLVKFDLAAVLRDYLGDVQIVAEFANYGEEIFERFESTMAGLIENHPKVKKIYIVAHSEGTVVAFRGLLEALSATPAVKWKERWVDRVAGLMTIGSPINKHIVMWPDLWTKFKQASALPKKDGPIVWWNYYDFGDPVGFELNLTRDWLIENKWIKVAEQPPQRTAEEAQKLKRGLEAAIDGQPFFDFPRDNDVGFTRYPFPGKAHNDYWEDEGVFNHFLKTVMKLPHKQEWKIPESKGWWWVVSWILPYVLCLVLLGGGTYVLYKALSGIIEPAEPLGDLTRSVLGLALFIAGITVASRVPRLVAVGRWHVVSWGVFVFGVLAYWWIPSPKTHDVIGNALFVTTEPGGKVAMLAVGVLTAGVSSVLSKFYPSWGMRPLMSIGGAIAALIAVRCLWFPLVAYDLGKLKLWPIALALLGFVYLWWLAALLFDLIFVWHRYIRSSSSPIMDHLRKLQ